LVVASTTRAQPPVRYDLYGDPLPEGAISRLGTIRFRQADAIGSIAFIDNGSSLATNTQGKKINIWDTSTGKIRQQLTSRAASINQLTATPDGRTLAVLDNDGKVEIFDMPVGKSRIRIEDRSQNGRCVAISSDGKTVAVGSYGNEIWLWNTSSGKQLRKITGGLNGVAHLTFSPDCRTVAACGREGKFQAWDVGSGGPRFNATITGSGDAQSIAFSPDSTCVVGVGAEAKGAVVWEVASGKELLRLAGDATTLIACAAYSPDGKSIYTGLKTGDVRVWDSATGHPLQSYTGASGTINRLTLSKDGRWLAGASYSHTLWVWEIATGRLVTPTAAHTLGIYSLAFCPDGRGLVTASPDLSLRWWETTTGRPGRRLLQHQPNYLFNVAMSADGAMIATGGGKGIRIVDAATGLVKPTTINRTEYAFSVAISTDGKKLAVGESEQALIYDLATGKSTFRMRSPNMRVHSVTFSPDGSWLIFGGQEGVVRIVDEVSGRELRRTNGDQGHINRLACSPDGRIVATASRTISLWDALNGRRMMTLDKPQSENGENYSVAFSRDGRLLATGDNNGTVRLWEVLTGRELAKWKGHSGTIYMTAFSPDGRILATTSNDTTALLWNLTQIPGQGSVAARRLADAERDGFWLDLRDPDPAKAHRAIRHLIADVACVIPLMQNAIRPIPAVDPAHLARLIRELDDNQYRIRQKASAELLVLVPRIEGRLRQELKTNPSAEARNRIAQILGAETNPVPAGDELRALRAVEILERAATVDARAELKRLASGAPDARLTREARSALARMSDG
jgi:WD40 repeat protein